MSKRYPRAWKRKYQANRARAVADRLLGRKKYVPPDASPFFGGTEMQVPFQYGGSLLINNPRTSFVINGINGV
jgi:hypothetical protein